MAYDKNNLLAVKGRIGELLYAICAFKNYGWTCEESAELQKVGVDFIVREKKMTKYVDVKLSDKVGPFFSIAYRNSSGPRHPFIPGCRAPYLIIVTLNWDIYIAANLDKLQHKVPTKELAIEKLTTYMLKEECNKLVQQLESQDKRDTYTDLCHLLIAHRTLSRLEKELEKKQSFKDSEELMRNYVVSIDEILVSEVLSLAQGFNDFRNGHSRTDSKDNKLITKREYYTRFGNITAAEVYWSAVSTENIYKPDLNKSPVSVSKSLTSLNKPLSFGKKHKGRSVYEIFQVDPKYIDWMIGEIKTNPKSGFMQEYDMQAAELIKQLEHVKIS
jgi:hypothetical protein